MASSSQLVTLKTHKFYVRGADKVINIRDSLKRLCEPRTEDLSKKLIKTSDGIILMPNGVDLENDQTAKADKGKPRLSLVPTRAVEGIARIREYGCNKYPVGGQDNWKDVEPQRYIDALLRHAFAFKDDPCGVDEESGLPHLWHLMCNGAFLCELLGDEIDGKKM